MQRTDHIAHQHAAQQSMQPQHQSQITDPRTDEQSAFLIYCITLICAPIICALHAISRPASNQSTGDPHPPPAASKGMRRPPGPTDAARAPACLARRLGPRPTKGGDGDRGGAIPIVNKFQSSQGGGTEGCDKPSQKLEGAAMSSRFRAVSLNSSS